MPAFEGVWLINSELEVHLVPNNRGVITSFVGRGWRVTDLPRDLDADDPEFVEALQKLQAEDEAESKPAKTKKSAEAKSATEEEGNE